MIITNWIMHVYFTEACSTLVHTFNTLFCKGISEDVGYEMYCSIVLKFFEGSKKILCRRS